jgi:hypothetical protein
MVVMCAHAILAAYMTFMISEAACDANTPGVAQSASSSSGSLGAYGNAALTNGDVARVLFVRRPIHGLLRGSYIFLNDLRHASPQVAQLSYGKHAVG